MYNHQYQSENHFPLVQSDLDLFVQKMDSFIFDILGLQADEQGSSQSDALDKAMDLVITLRAKARENKDWNIAIREMKQDFENRMNSYLNS